MAERPKVLCIGLESFQLEVVTALIEGRFDLQILNFNSPLAEVETALGQAGLTLLRWHQRGDAVTLLSRLGKDVKALPTRLAGIYGAGDRHSRPDERGARKLGITSFIELPSRYFEVSRLLDDLAPVREAADPGEAREQATAFRRLALVLASGTRTTEALPMLRRTWEFYRKAAVFPPRAGMILWHWDSGLGESVAQVLRSSGAPLVSTFASFDDTMEELRRGTQGLVLWYDGIRPEPGILLEHLAEARDLSAVPVLVLVPGPSALQHLAQHQRGALFDALTVFDRKRGSLKTALASLRTPQGDAAHALLETLRHSPLSLAEARTLCAKLTEKPGKGYWANVELLLYLLRSKLAAEAEAVVERLAVDRPDAFSSMLCRWVYTAAQGDVQAAARGLVAATLRYPTLTRDRMFRVGRMLDRWRAPDALADLLDAWWVRPDFADDHQLPYLAGCYYRLLGKHHIAGMYFAMAALGDPLRPHFLSGMRDNLESRRLQPEADELGRMLQELEPQGSGNTLA